VSDMESKTEFKYWAFISYSHTDAAWAKWLHKTLERYRVPRRLVGRATERGCNVPRRIFPVFLDREELPGSSDLGQNIKEALRQSRYLIVICSPQSAASLWVNEEIRLFKAMGGEHRILPLIIEGEPNAGDKPECRQPECFPAALRFHVDAQGQITTERAEPVAADARHDHDGRQNSKLKLLAGILGVNYDELKQRERRRRFLRTVEWIAASFLILLAGFGMFQWQEARKQALSRQNKAQQLVKASAEARAGRQYLKAATLAKSALLVEDSVRTRLAFWESVGKIPQEGRALYAGLGSGAGIAVLPDGRVCFSTPREVVIVQPSGSAERIPHDVGMSLTLRCDSGLDRVFVAGMSGRIVGFELRSKKKIFFLDTGSAENALSMDLAAEAHLLFVGTKTGSVLAYDTTMTSETAAPVKELPLSDTGVTAIAACSDGRKLYALAGRELLACDVENGKTLWNQQITATGGLMRLSSDGSLVALAGMDGALIVVNAATGAITRQLPLDLGVHAVAFSPDSQRLCATTGTASGGQRNGFVEWGLSTAGETLVYEFPSGLSTVTYRDDSRIVALSINGVLLELSRLDLRQMKASGAIAWKFAPGPGKEDVLVFRCGVLPDSDPRNDARMLMHRQAFESIEVWRGSEKSGGHVDIMTPAQETIPVNIPAEKISAMTPLGKNSLVIGTVNGELFEIDLNRLLPKPLKTRFQRRIDFLLGQAPNRLIVGFDSVDESQGVYEIRDGRLVPVFLIPVLDASFVERITAARFSPDGRLALIALGNSMTPSTLSDLKVIDLDTRKPVSERSIDGGMILAIEPLAGGRKWALGLNSGRILILAVNRWNEPGARLSTASSPVPIHCLTTMKWQRGKPDELLAAGDANGCLTFWDSATGELLYETDSQGAPITALHSGPSGEDLWLGIGSSVELWQRVGTLSASDALLKDVRMEYVEDLVNRAKSLKEAGRTQEALVLYNKLACLLPKQFLSEVSGLCELLGQYKEALEAVNRSHMVNDDIWINLPSTVMGGSDQESELQILRFYHSQVSRRCGQLYQNWWLRDGNPEQLEASLSNYWDAVRQDPTNPNNTFFMLALMLTTGRFSQVRDAALIMYRFHLAMPGDQNPRIFAILAIYASLAGSLDASEPRRMLRQAGSGTDKDPPKMDPRVYQLLLEEMPTALNLEKETNANTRAKIRFLLGCQALKAGNRQDAERHFTSGVKDGDLLRLSRQALDMMQGTHRRPSMDTNILVRIEEFFHFLDLGFQIADGRLAEPGPSLRDIESALGEALTPDLQGELVMRVLLDIEKQRRSGQKIQASSWQGLIRMFEWLAGVERKLAWSDSADLYQAMHIAYACAGRPDISRELLAKAAQTAKPLPENEKIFSVKTLGDVTIDEFLQINDDMERSLDKGCLWDGTVLGKRAP